MCSLLIFLFLLLTGAQAVVAEPKDLTRAKSQAAALEERLAEFKAQTAILREKYETAQAQLAETEVAAAENAALLAQAQLDQVSAEKALSDRLVHIYKQGRGRALDVLLSSDSFTDLFDRVAVLERIGEQDADLLEQVRAYRAQVADRETELTALLQKQEAATADVDAARDAMAQKLAQAEQSLEGKEAEVAQLQAEWKERQAEQARLQREREARLQLALADAQAAAQAASRDQDSGSTGDGGSSNSGGGSGSSSGGNSGTTTTTKSGTSGGGGSGGQTHNASVPNILKPEQIAMAAQKAGFSGENLVIAVAVALAESSGNANAIGRLKTYGLWQILASAHPTKINPSNPDASRWYDPYVNAGFAWTISNKGANWRPWSVYTSGSYLRRMDKARAGVELLLNDPGSVVPPTAK